MQFSVKDGGRVRNIGLDIIISLCKLRRLPQSINNIMLIDSSLPEGALVLIVRTISLPAEGGGFRRNSRFFVERRKESAEHRLRYYYIAMQIAPAPSVNQHNPYIVLIDSSLPEGALVLATDCLAPLRVTKYNHYIRKIIQLN